MKTSTSIAGGDGTKLAPFTPSGKGALDFALELLQLKPDDILYDLGCGDARMLVHAVTQTGCKCVGIEYNSELAARARKRVTDSESEDFIEIRHEDALKSNITNATALFMYLVPEGIKLLSPKLEEAKAKGVRIVTYVFSIPDWIPDDTRDFKGTKIYLYNSNKEF